MFGAVSGAAGGGSRLLASAMPATTAARPNRNMVVRDSPSSRANDGCAPGGKRQQKQRARQHRQCGHQQGRISGDIGAGEHVVGRSAGRGQEHQRAAQQRIRRGRVTCAQRQRNAAEREGHACQFAGSENLRSRQSGQHQCQKRHQSQDHRSPGRTQGLKRGAEGPGENAEEKNAQRENRQSVFSLDARTRHSP